MQPAVDPAGVDSRSIEQPSHAASRREREQERGVRLGRKRVEQCKNASPMRLQHVEATHQHVEEPVAHRAVGRRLIHGRLIGEHTETKQDRRAAWETRTRTRQRQTGGACRLSDAHVPPAVAASEIERGGDQSSVEVAVVHTKEDKQRQACCESLSATRSRSAARQFP